MLFQESEALNELSHPHLRTYIACILRTNNITLPFVLRGNWTRIFPRDVGALRNIANCFTSSFFIFQAKSPASRGGKLLKTHVLFAEGKRMGNFYEREHLYNPSSGAPPFNRSCRWRKQNRSNAVGSEFCAIWPWSVSMAWRASE